MRIFSWTLLLLIGSLAFGATPYKRSLVVKKNAYIQDGVFIGGESGTGATLLGVRRANSQKTNLERVIVDIGNRAGKADPRAMGYFQASVDSQQNRIVLDIAQLKNSAVTEKSIRNLFKKSPYVASTNFTLDPEDKSATMVLNLNRPMKLEVFQLKAKGKPARIVMDMTPSTITKIKKR